MGMAKLTFGRLTEAWKGEAADFTPLLAAQLDSLGNAIGVDLTALGESEVATTGGRRIDIVAQVEDGSEFVIENQYGRADHDHLTRGLAYAVARRARGLVVVAEEHRDEFRAVAQYLNELAELDSERGIAVWLVEAKAVRIENSAWAPLFTAVVEPNQFTATVEKAKQSETVTLEEFFDQFDVADLRQAAEALVGKWQAAGYRRRLGPKHVVLEASGPSAGGIRTVVAVFNDGHVLVPFSAYAGLNSGIPIESLTTPEFRDAADQLFGFNGTEKQARTVPGWLTPERVNPLLTFCSQVADAYKAALAQGPST
ncbi:hypothetical protein EV651_111103 [Kribbella sp. VKM Ac-2571]|nr:hypothetical protein EV651_111103 [Kribbella sp. VKM Ac-2571]